MKPNKEEEELIKDAEGFVDDSEVVHFADEVMSEFDEEGEEDSAKESMVVGDSEDVLETGEDELVVVRRKKYVARNVDKWIPPHEVQQKFAELELAVDAAFSTTKDWNDRLQFGLGREIDGLILVADTAAVKALPNNKRSAGYLAHLMLCFPIFFSRGRVVAHLKRVLLENRLMTLNKIMNECAREAFEAIFERCKSPHGVLSPSLSSSSSLIVDSAKLKGSIKVLSKSNDPNDPFALAQFEEIAQWASAGFLASDVVTKMLKHVMDAWASRALERTLANFQSPPDAFVSARDALQNSMQSEPYFVWDGTSRGSVWRLSQMCRICARSRQVLDAWVAERRADLVCGVGSGPVKDFRPRPRNLIGYLTDAERYLKKAFFPVKLHMTANVARALRERPADFYLVNDQGDYMPFVRPVILKAIKPDVIVSAADAMELEDFEQHGVVSHVVSHHGVLESDSITSPSFISMTHGSFVDLSQDSSREPLFAPSQGKKFINVEFHETDFLVKPEL